MTGRGRYGGQRRTHMTFFIRHMYILGTLCVYIWRSILCLWLKLRGVLNMLCTQSMSTVALKFELTWPKGQKVPSVLPPSASFTSQHATQTTQTTTHKLSSNTTDGPQASGKRQSSRSPPTASASNKNNFNQPRGRPPDKTKKKPRLTRPPKSDSEVPTRNMFNPLYTEAGDGDGSSSDSDCPNPF